MPSPHHRAVIYLRGKSAQTQEVVLHAYAAVNGYDVVAIIRDATASANVALRERPDWLRAVNLIQNNEADLILVDMVSRVTRRAEEWTSLAAQGIQVVSASD